MGMAASQARYLELTARKSNVEYEGQQINQQRVDLANQSAGLFNQLMGLSVPTPPSSSDYTTTQYTFNNGQTTNTITSMTVLTGDPNYNYNVTYTYPLSQYTGFSQIRTDLGARFVTTTVGSTTTSAYWLTDGASGGKAINQQQLTQCSATSTSYKTDQTAIEQAIATTDPTHQSAFAKDYYGYTTPGGVVVPGSIANIYKYTSASGVTNYYGVTDLNAMPSDGSKASLTDYYAATVDQTQTVTDKANVTQNTSGRFSTIKLASQPANTMDLTTTSKTNEQAYNDAMNQYTYNQQSYEQTVNAINAKTSIIQQEDKELELRLRQCDTEQQALSTEMDAVKKVIDKNIESTFKTFAN